jgi:hypothetical protein
LVAVRAAKLNFDGVKWIELREKLTEAVSLFFPSFVRLIDVFNTLLVFLTLLSLL